MPTRSPASGLKLVASLGLLFSTVACQMDGLLGNNEGRVRLTLARDDAGVAASVVASEPTLDNDDDDRPGGWSFSAATVTLSSIMVRRLDGVLVPLEMTLPMDVDVVKIDGGKQLQLPDAALPVGDYDQVVLVMTAVEGTTNDGTAVTVEPPGGGWTAIVPICPLAVVEGGTATVALTLNVRRSFLRAGGWWSFHPRFAARLNCDVV